MKERPALFNPEMVTGILNLTKTKTRRIVKYPTAEGEHGWFKTDTGFEYKLGGSKRPVCPYGKKGDRLWVKETHYLYGFWNKSSEFTKTGKQKYEFICDKEYKAKYLSNPPSDIKTKKSELGWFKRPSIFMYRWASRIQLEINNIRTERIQEISASDCLAEGINIDPEYFKKMPGKILAFEKFKSLWDSINEKRGYSWDKNPWVWVVEFKVIS